MSKFTFTPGPWNAEPDGFDAYRIKSEDFGGVAYLHDPLASALNRNKELTANARLIAAAPELAGLLADIQRNYAATSSGAAFATAYTNRFAARASALLARINA